MAAPTSEEAIPRRRAVQLVVQLVVLCRAPQRTAGRLSLWLFLRTRPLYPCPTTSAPNATHVLFGHVRTGLLLSDPPCSPPAGQHSTAHHSTTPSSSTQIALRHRGVTHFRAPGLCCLPSRGLLPIIKGRFHVSWWYLQLNHLALHLVIPRQVSRLYTHPHSTSSSDKYQNLNPWFSE